MRTAGTVLRDGVWLLVGGLLLGLVVAALLQLFLPRTYTSASTYYVSPRAGAPAVAGGDARIESYEALAESARVAGDASGLLGGIPTGPEVQDSLSSSRRGSVLEIRAEAATPRDAELLNSAAGTAFTRLVDQVERADQPVGAPLLAVQLVDPPSEPTAPTFPRWTMLLPLGVVLGLVLGIVAAVVRPRTRRAIGTPENLVLRLGGPVLGVVPHRRRPPPYPVPLLDPPAADLHARGARRHTAVHLRLRSALRTATRGGVLVLVGAGRGQATTTLALDVAVGFAAGGERVVLVDTDRHAGPVAARLELDPGPGLAEVAAGAVPVEHALQRWAPGGLAVLTAGAPPSDDAPDPRAAATAGVIDVLRSRYDRVVVDTPGAPAGGAAIDLARRADAVVVVVRRGALDEDVDATVAALRLAGAPVVGGVLTGARSVPVTSTEPRPVGAGQVDDVEDPPTGPTAIPGTDGAPEQDVAAGSSEPAGSAGSLADAPGAGPGSGVETDAAPGDGTGTDTDVAPGGDTAPPSSGRRRRRAERPHPVTPAESP